MSNNDPATLGGAVYWLDIEAEEGDHYSAVGWKPVKAELERLRAIESRAQEVAQGRVRKIPSSGTNDLAADVARLILGNTDR